MLTAEHRLTRGACGWVLLRVTQPTVVGWELGVEINETLASVPVGGGIGDGLVYGFLA